MKQNSKRRLIYSNFWDEYGTEKDAREWLFEEYGEYEEWESIDDVPDDRVWDELAFQDEVNWDNEKYELEKFFNGGYWLLQGSAGLWWGRSRGGFVFSTLNEMSKAWERCDYVRLYDENGHFYIDAAHHDGTNHYEVKRLTDKGLDYLNNHMWDPDEEVHDVLFNSNFYTALPHYAHQVFGCKKREVA